MKYKVIIEKGEDGYFVATVPSLLGCISQGKTLEETIANIKEAAEGYIEVCKEYGDPIPEEDIFAETTIEVEVAA